MTEETELVAILIRQRIDEELRLHKRIAALSKALAPLVAAYEKSCDPIGDSDLYDEQPIAIRCTLGDYRRAQRALRP